MSLTGIGNFQRFRYQFEAYVVFECCHVDAAHANLLPSASRIMIVTNKLRRQRVELRLSRAFTRCVLLRLAEVVPNIEENNDQEVECINGSCFDGKASV